MIPLILAIAAAVVAPPPDRLGGEIDAITQRAHAGAAGVGEEAAALAAANQLLGRLTGKDPAAMQALTLPEGGATAVSTGKDGKSAVRHFTWPDFFAHLPKDKPIVEEQMRDPLVRVDGDVAMSGAGTR